MKLIFSLLLLVTCLIALPSTLVTEAKVESTLKIGIIAPLTGGVATWGLSVRTAIEIANEASPHPAALFFEDEETCIPRKALSAYHHLRSAKKVDVIVSSCLEGGQAIAPLALKHNIPFFISGRSSREFQAKHPNTLSWLTLLDYEGEAISNLTRERKWKSGTAMVWSGYFGVQFAQGIQAALVQSKSNSTFKTIEVDQGSSPQRAEVQRLIRDKPEAVFLMMSEPAAAYVVKQLKALRYEGEIVLQSSMLQTDDPEVRKDFVGALQQKFVVDDVKYSQIRSEIKKTLGESVADDFVFSYDGFSVLLGEARSCYDSNTSNLNACLSKKLRNGHWRTGASGKFRFMQDGSTERPMVFKIVTRSGFRNLG